jgi:hypothetical protein
MMTITIHQIYYEQSQLSQLSPDSIPYLNPQSDNSWKFHETDVFCSQYINGHIDNEGLTGFLSWRFKDKTNISVPDFKYWINANPGYDVYFINPFPELAIINTSVWHQGEGCHPGLIALAHELLNRIGYSIDLNTMVNDKSTMLFCNYWVGNIAFWDKYMEFLLPIYSLFAEQTDFTKRYFADAGYHTGAGFLTFILERLFSTFITNNTDIKYLAFQYNDLQHAYMIRELRHKANM